MSGTQQYGQMQTGPFVQHSVSKVLLVLLQIVSVVLYKLWRERGGDHGCTFAL
jgi:hypothetical protein